MNYAASNISQLVAFGRGWKSLPGIFLLFSSLLFIPSLSHCGEGDPIMMYGMTAANSLDFSPDGSSVLVAHSCAMVLDSSDSTVLNCLFAHDWKVSSARFSPDGAQLVTGGTDAIATLWDVATGEALRDFVGHTDQVTSVAFSPNGAQVLTGSMDGTAILWNASTGAEVRTFSGHTGEITSVDFSQDGSKVLTGSTDQTAQTWNVNTGAVITSFSGHSSTVTSVAFSPDGSSAFSGAGSSAFVWDVNSGTTDQSITTDDPVTCVAYSPDGNRILTAEESGDVHLWNPSNGIKDATFVDPNPSFEPFRTVAAFSDDGSEVVVGGENLESGVRLYDVSSGDLIREIGSTDPISKGFFSPNKKQIATNSLAKDVVHLWDIETGAIVQTLQGHTGQVETMGFSQLGRKIVTGSSDGTAKIWRVSNGEILATLTGHTERISGGARFSPDESMILTGSYDDTCKLWDANTGDLIRTLSGHTSNIFSTEFSPDGRHVVSGSPDETARVWDVASGDTTLVYTGHTDGVNSVNFSPDGTKVVSGSRDTTCKIWDTVTGDTLFSFEEHTGPVMIVTYSPNGSYILSGALDGRALIWIAETGEVVKEFQSDIDIFPLDQSRFSADGTAVLRWNKNISDDFELPVVLWDLDIPLFAVTGLDDWWESH